MVTGYLNATNCGITSIIIGGELCSITFHCILLWQWHTFKLSGQHTYTAYQGKTFKEEKHICLFIPIWTLVKVTKP